MLPQAVLSIIFIVGIGNGILQGFGIIPSLGMTTPTLQYYIEVFSRADLAQSLGFSFYIALTSSVLATVFGVAICAVMVELGKEKGWFAKILQIPIMVPHIVVVLFIINLFSQSGMAARIFYHLGLISGQEVFPSFLYDANGAGIILSYLWKEIPFVAYYVLPIMANISRRLGEAAVNLGASPVKAFFKVTLPLSMPTIKNAFLMIFAFAFGAYELPLLLGPTIPKALSVQAYIQYTHPDLKNRPYAMAMNGLITIITLVIAWFYYRLLEEDQRKEAANE